MTKNKYEDWTKAPKKFSAFDKGQSLPNVKSFLKEVDPKGSKIVKVGKKYNVVRK